MLIPKEWLPKAKMVRIICHWTAGSYKASDMEKEHYHILIEDNGKLIRGNHSIADNMDCTDGDYAAHTGGANTRAIGISMCCMANATERPFNPGKFPMTEKQWDTLCRVAAELCKAYDIPVNSRSVLGHGEAHQNLGTVGNKGKWDTMVLPFRPSLNREQVGNLLRTTVDMYLHEQEMPPEVVPTATVIIRGERFTDAFMDNGSVFVKARPVAEKFGFTITPDDNESVIITQDGKSFTIPAQERNDSRYVAVREIAETFDLSIEWDKKTRTVTIS